MSIWKDVTEFHLTFKHPVEVNPIELGILDTSIMIDLKNAQSTLHALRHKLSNKVNVATKDVTKLRLLRMSLLVEEFAEYLQAEEFNDMVEIADALGDLHYIAAGTEIAYGIDGQAVFTEIQRSNMAKLDADGNPVFDIAGKVIKPIGWEPPNIADIINSVEPSVSKSPSSV